MKSKPKSKLSHKEIEALTVSSKRYQKIMESSDKDKGHKKIPEVKIFPVPFVLGEIKHNYYHENSTSKSHNKFHNTISKK